MTKCREEEEGWGEEGWGRRGKERGVEGGGVEEEGREKSGGNSHFLLLFLFLTEAQGEMLFEFMYNSLRWGGKSNLFLYTDVSWT